MIKYLCVLMLMSTQQKEVWMRIVLYICNCLKMAFCFIVTAVRLNVQRLPVRQHTILVCPYPYLWKYKFKFTAELS